MSLHTEAISWFLFVFALYIADLSLVVHFGLTIFCPHFQDFLQLTWEKTVLKVNNNVSLLGT